MIRKHTYTLIILFSLIFIFSLGGYLYIRNRATATPESTDTVAKKYMSATVLPGDGLSSEDTQSEFSEDAPSPFSAVPAVPDPACFTYEELADGTLRITGYDEKKNTQNPYQVIIPSVIDGKPVSTLGAQSITTSKILELIISDGITTLENNVLASGCDRRLITFPDSVVNIDQAAFHHNEYDYIMPVIISCYSENSYAYQYATENDFACRLTNPTSAGNKFLQDYASGPHTSHPYLSHFCEKGDLYDYVVIEYLDISRELQANKDSEYFTSSSIWQSNEFTVLVLDKESGSVLQCIDYSSFNSDLISLLNLPHVRSDNLLSAADYNFDGNPDLSLYLGDYGTGAVSYYVVFLFDESRGLYEDHGFYMRNMILKPDKQSIDCYERGGPAEHYVNRYQYIDETLTCVARLSMYDIWENGARGAGVRDERLMDGDWQTYREENIYLEDDFSDEAYQRAYEQLKYLYVGDGYWDL